VVGVRGASVKRAFRRELQRIPPDAIAGGLDQLEKRLARAMASVRGEACQQKRDALGLDRDRVPPAVPGVDAVFVEWRHGTGRILQVDKDGQCSDAPDGLAVEGHVPASVLPTLDFYYSTELTVSEGALLAYRALGDAIDVLPEMVGRPVDVWVVQGTPGNERAARLRGTQRAALDDLCALWQAKSIDVLIDVCSRGQWLDELEQEL
jgi:hypothetical protein